MKIGELFVELNIKADTTKLNDFIRSMGELNMSSVLAALGVSGVALAMVDITEKALKYGQSISNLHSLTGMSTKDIQQWGQAAERLGFSMEDVTTAYRNFRQLVLEVQMGSFRMAAVFLHTGIAPTKDPMKFWQEFRKFLLDPKIDEAWKDMVSREAQVSDGLRMILTNSQVFDSIQKSIYLTDEETRVLNESWIKIIDTLQKLKMGPIKEIADVILTIRELGRELGEWSVKSPTLHFLNNPNAGAQSFMDAVSGLMPMITNPAAATAGAMRGNTNTFTFHITGPVQTIADAVEAVIKKYFKSTEGQSPHQEF